MRLVVDTSVLVGELLRTSGRDRLADDRLQLFLPEQMWDEARVELPHRIGGFVRRRGLSRTTGESLASTCPEAIETNIVIVAAPIYLAVESEARARSARDPDDWPVVACAIALSADVWTNDNDFLGTGVPTWTTQTLTWWLQSQTDE